MPGRRLSQQEQKLLSFWQNPPANFEGPLLRQMQIESAAGLRGIHNLLVPIPFPLTAICGRNGVGKSTVLALAALSAAPPRNWRGYWSNVRPRHGRDNRVRYTFNDFFHQAGGRGRLDGLAVNWVSVSLGNEIQIAQRLKQSRWTRHEDAARHPRVTKFPVRAIDFIPVSRVLPAVESDAVRRAFAGQKGRGLVALDGDTLKKLSYVMGRAYKHAETRVIRGLGLAHCTVSAPYSAFDMGSGENSVLLLLSRLQEAPVGCLVLIEEVELGLHVEAQTRLIEVLLDICLKKRIQVICTTHSEAVLDALPRQARVLLRRNGSNHEAVSNVSTRFALHEMSGSVRPELVVYTEDRFASVLVEEALAGTQRSRVDVRDVGSNATVARQAISHLRLHAKIPALSAFDGDSTEASVREWIRSERGERNLQPDWLILPADTLSPEAWILRELRQMPYLANLKNELSCSEGEAVAHLDAMAVQLDNHDCGFVLSQRTGLEPETARRMVIRSVARQHPGLTPLRDKVSALLDR